MHPCTLEGFAAAYGPALSLPQTSAPGAPAPAPAPATGAAAIATLPAAADAAPASCPFVRDGVYLLHRQGHYCPGPATTPLALLWKDLGCSRWGMEGVL